MTFVMDKGKILGTYARESLGNEDLEELYFSVTGQQEGVGQRGQSGQENRAVESSGNGGPEGRER